MLNGKCRTILDLLLSVSLSRTELVAKFSGEKNRGGLHILNTILDKRFETNSRN